MYKYIPQCNGVLLLSESSSESELKGVPELLWQGGARDELQSDGGCEDNHSGASYIASKSEEQEM